MESLLRALLKELFGKRVVKQVAFPEEALVLLIELTELTHLTVYVEQSSLCIIERHRHHTGIKDFTVVVA